DRAVVAGGWRATFCIQRAELDELLLAGDERLRHLGAPCVAAAGLEGMLAGRDEDELLGLVHEVDGAELRFLAVDVDARAGLDEHTRDAYLGADLVEVVVEFFLGVGMNIRRKPNLGFLEVMRGFDVALERRERVRKIGGDVEGWLERMRPLQERQ